MDDLLQKYNDYIHLKNCRAEYLLSNGMVIDFTYKEEKFHTSAWAAQINRYTTHPVI